MRPALVVGGVCTLLAGSVIALAQTGTTSSAPPAQPLKEMIVAQDVEVRSGGTTEYYATTKLRAGDKVIVVGDSTQFKGWLAIKPPPGSFSWVNSLHIQRTGEYSGIVM